MINSGVGDWDEDKDDAPAITITPDGVINYNVKKLFRTNEKQGGQI